MLRQTKTSLGRTVVATCLLCLALVLPLPLQADQGHSGSVEAEGVASIVAGNKDKAREAALQNAFRRAVEQVVGVAVESKTVVKDAELLNDKIFSRSSGFIKTYRITHDRVEGDTYHLTIVAAVSRYKLEQGLDDAGLLIRKLGKPRVAIVVLEKNADGQRAAGGLVENQITATLGKRGYALVDRQAMLAVEREAAKGQGDQTDAVLRAASAGGAEVVILGQAEAAAAPAVGGTSLRPVQVTATVRAVDVDSGELLATASSNQRALNVNPAAAGSEALQKAAAELTEALHRQVVAAWTKRLTGLRTVRLTVSGIPQADLQYFQEALREQLARVEVVHERGYRDGQARFDLEAGGSLADLRTELASLELGGATVRITGYSAGQLQLHWQARTAKGGRTK